MTVEPPSPSLHSHARADLLVAERLWFGRHTQNFGSFNGLNEELYKDRAALKAAIFQQAQMCSYSFIILCIDAGLGGKTLSPRFLQHNSSKGSLTLIATAHRRTESADLHSIIYLTSARAVL